MMIRRYFKFVEFIAKLKVPGLQQFKLSEREKGSLNSFLKQLGEVDYLTKQL